MCASKGTYSGTMSETLQCDCFPKNVFLNAMKVFLCNYFAVKAKRFYRHCLVKLLNKSICSECGVFCISKLSCVYFSPFPESALPLPALRNSDTCTWVRSWTLAFTPATTNNHRSNSSPPLLAGDGCCAKESARMGGQTGSRTLLSVKRSHYIV